MKFSRDSEWFAPFVLILGAAVFFGLVIGAIFLVRPPMENLGKTQQPIYSFDTKTRSILLETSGTGGKVRFSVPENHIRAIESRKGKNKKDIPYKITMHALLPHFEGYQRNNWWLFDSSSPSARVVLIQVEQIQSIISERTRFNFLLRAQLEKNAQQNAALGLTHYLYKQAPKREEQDVFTGNVFTGLDRKKQQLVYFCFRPTALSVAPNCSRTKAIALDTQLTYRFKRNHLMRWREIENKIEIFIARIHQLSFGDEGNREGGKRLTSFE